MKECEHCFEMVENDVELCDACEEEERLLDEEDEMDEDDFDEFEDEDEELEMCNGCGHDFHPSELNGDLCDGCEADLDEDAAGE